MESRCSITSFQKGLLLNEIKLQTDNYTTVLVENLQNANSFQNQSLFCDISHEHVFAYRKNHGTDTALLSLTEQWRKELDQHNIIGIVSMDLSKAFDTLPHDLITAKFKSYGADDKTTQLIHDYLTNQRQRVRLGDHLSNWKEISTGDPQGSILGPLILILIHS